MEFTRRTAQLLHEDHHETLVMIENLEAMIAAAKRKLPDINDSTVRSTLEKAATSIQKEVRDHFAFEESELFTRLAELGDEDIGNHLRDEHKAILPLGVQVSDLAKAALIENFTDDSWQQFKEIAAELIERMLSHIQKEEMALLPLLDEILDSETDFKLSENYGSTH